MKPKSRKARTVRRSADQIRNATPADLDRLRAGMRERIDTSEIPESRQGFKRARRTSLSPLTKKPPSPLRDAILAELGREDLTRYELWKRARRHCATLSESAVYEFLRGERQIGSAYVEAMLAALGLTVGRARRQSA
jgi:hypothetical protein